MKLILVIALAALLAAPCVAIGEGDEDDAAPGLMSTSGLVLYYNTTAPMSFPAMTPRDVPESARKLGVVVGRSCQRGLAVPLSADIRSTSVSGNFGDGGYSKALADIKAAHPDVTGIYDVISDVEYFSILGIYRSQCTFVTARAFALASVAAPKIP